MQWRFCARSILIGSIFLMASLAIGARVEVHAQAQQVNGFNAYDPRWALATPYMSAGLNADSSLQQLYTTTFGSGTAGLFVESRGRDGGAGASGNSSNLFGNLSPTLQRQDWFANLANPAWTTSIVGSYKSTANTTLFNGLYATASFGMAGIRSNPLGFSGLPNFAAGNDVVGLTAGASLGLQVTPQITIEGGFTWTQVPASTFR